MDYKVINSKMKEIYFTPRVIEDEEANKSDFTFWSSMQVLATTNISIQNLKMA